MMKPRKLMMMSGLLVVLGLYISACYNPMNPTEINLMNNTQNPDQTLRIAALDYQVGDLDDPAVLAKYARADLLVVGTWQFWETSADLNKIRAANPNIKILAYLRSKAVRSAWTPEDETQDLYTHQLYRAELPYLVYTTEGDTASDWPGTYLFDFTKPEARAAVLNIFHHFQQTSNNKFDGVFWDYFSPKLWVPEMDSVHGDPDMDQDGVPHFVDDDEIERFLRGQEAWIDEMRAMEGDDFIQIANGVRALRDSTFAAKVDGMFYEDFPAQGFNGSDEFRMALDPTEFNNLWAAHNWPRTQNGGPWLILSHFRSAGYYWGPDFQPLPIDADDLTRAVAMLTDATAITYDGTDIRSAGVPRMDYDLGRPLSGVTIDYPRYSREFEHGRIVLTMRSGAYPWPFDFEVYQNGTLVDQSPYPAAEN